MGETSLIERSKPDAALSRAFEDAFWAAFDAAVATEGATAPNPPVGCAALDIDGRVLAVAAHAGAGQAHAEAAAIAQCRARGVVERIDTLLVTLEPCNHTGRTPPCVQAILGTPARRVLIGTADPNPHVAGGGAAALTAAGLEVRFLVDVPGAERLTAASSRLLAPFVKRITTGLPWVTVKRAFDPTGGMIPPPGAKTFAAPASLDLAHALRRRADAILTGVGTVIADNPLFNVRRVPDHAGRRRTLVVMDLEDRMPARYAAEAAQRGLDVRVESDLAAAVARLGDEGCLEVLVEAGPRVSAAALATDLWDEAVTIHVQAEGDRIDRAFRQPHPQWEGLDVLRHR